MKRKRLETRKNMLMELLSSIANLDTSFIHTLDNESSAETLYESLKRLQHAEILTKNNYLLLIQLPTHYYLRVVKAFVILKQHHILTTENRLAVANDCAEYVSLELVRLHKGNVLNYHTRFLIQEYRNLAVHQSARLLILLKEAGIHNYLALCEDIFNQWQIAQLLDLMVTLTELKNAKLLNEKNTKIILGYKYSLTAAILHKLRESLTILANHKQLHEASFCLITENDPADALELSHILLDAIKRGCTPEVFCGALHIARQTTFSGKDILALRTHLLNYFTHPFFLSLRDSTHKDLLLGLVFANLYQSLSLLNFLEEAKTQKILSDAILMKILEGCYQEISEAPLYKNWLSQIFRLPIFSMQTQNELENALDELIAPQRIAHPLPASPFRRMSLFSSSPRNEAATPQEATAIPRNFFGCTLV